MSDNARADNRMVKMAELWERTSNAPTSCATAGRYDPAPPQQRHAQRARAQAAGRAITGPRDWTPDPLPDGGDDLPFLISRPPPPAPRLSAHSLVVRGATNRMATIHVVGDRQRHHLRHRRGAARVKRRATPGRRAIERQRRGTGVALPNIQAQMLRCNEEQSAPRSHTKASGAMQGAGDPRYGSADWKRLRAKVLRERPQCQGECGGFHRSRYADHIVEVRDDASDANFFSETNIQALCPRYHGRKSRRAEARRKGRPSRSSAPSIAA